MLYVLDFMWHHKSNVTLVLVYSQEWEDISPQQLMSVFQDALGDADPSQLTPLRTGKFLLSASGAPALPPARSGSPSGVSSVTGAITNMTLTQAAAQHVTVGMCVGCSLLPAASYGVVQSG